MKDSWSKERLGHLVTIQKGKISEQSQFPKKGFLPIINTDLLRGDIKVWGKSKGSVLCNENDVLILWDGERSGLCAIGFDGVVGSTFAKMSVIDKIIPQYLFRYVDYNFEWIQNQRTGTGVPHVPKDLNKILEIKFPPLPQQRKIANILSTVDAVIVKTEAAIAKYQQLKQGLMHDLFTRGIDAHTGQLRPKQEEAPELYKMSALGWIPKEWEVEELGNLIIGKGDYGINAPAVNFDPKYYTYLRITDISEDGYFIEKGKKSVNHIEARNFILEDGDIVFARTGNSTGKTYLYRRSDGILVFAGFLIRFRPDSTKLNSTFLKFITETPYYKNWVSVYSARTGQPGINGYEYSKLTFVLPSVEEQHHIAKKLNALNEKIQTEQQALAKYQQLKAGLMQDLLTGRVEVSG